MQALWAADRLDKPVTTACSRITTWFTGLNSTRAGRRVPNVSMGVIPYSPLGGGFLTGKYRPTRWKARAAEPTVTSTNNWALLEKMDIIGRQNGSTISQIALAWLLTDP